MKHHYELYLIDNDNLILELSGFLQDKTSDFSHGTLLRPNDNTRHTWFRCFPYLTDEDADYVVLRFGVTLRKI